MGSYRASTKTAYDLGYRTGREEDTDPGPVPDYIANDPDLLESYDRGLREGTDSLDDDGSGTLPPKPAHRPSASPKTRKRRASSKPASGRASTSDTAPTGGGGGSSFSLPKLHPTLRPDGSNVAGFLIGLGLYAVGANLLRNGPQGVGEWFNAKFFNKVNGQSPDVVNDPQDAGGSDLTPATPATPKPGKTFKLPKAKHSGTAPKGTPKTPSAHLAKPGRGKKPELAK